MSEARAAGHWGYDPAREAAWRAAIYPALLRTMARHPEWGRAVLQVWAERRGEDAAEALRLDARRVWQAMRDAGEL
jgi:hypothetical protein